MVLLREQRSTFWGNSALAVGILHSVEDIQLEELQCIGLSGKRKLDRDFDGAAVNSRCDAAGRQRQRKVEKQTSSGSQIWPTDVKLVQAVRVNHVTV